MWLQTLSNILQRCLDSLNQTQNKWNYNEHVRGKWNKKGTKMKLKQELNDNFSQLRKKDLMHTVFTFWPLRVISV